MNSFEITKCNADGCTGAKVNGDLAIVVLGVAAVALGLGIYCIHQHYELKREIAFASLNSAYPDYLIAQS